ncbi:MAG: hypothetical protein ORN54_01260, partial [Cyclobacteriaceae bacterium]|nr:hypothetical protein [Cyclobacteriaceae bacterium]
MRVFIFFLLLGSCLSAVGKTWVVDYKGKLNSIKSAIAFSAHGDTIRITKGIYKEGNLVIQKSIVLVGVDYPVLDGENKFEIFTIAANDVSIIGLRINVVSLRIFIAVCSSWSMLFLVYVFSDFFYSA